MSFVKVQEGLFDTLTLLTKPERSYTSSSSGIDGDLKVFKRSSTISKQKDDYETIGFFEDTIEGRLYECKLKSKTEENILVNVQKYIEAVNRAGVEDRFDKSVDVIRFEPSPNFTPDTLRKNIVKEVLLKHYNIAYPSIGWGYTNYCSINFPQNSGINCGIIYPNNLDNNSQPIFTPKNQFTIEFYLKPTFEGSTYSAGTILHMSSCFAVSLLSGTNKDSDGNISSFKLLLQLTHSTNTDPAGINLSSLGTYPNNYSFVTEDFKINKNNWHHVSIVWSPDHNHSTGSIYVDNQVSCRFYIDKNADLFSASKDGNSFLNIGTYYTGENNSTKNVRGLFGKTTVEKEGHTNTYNALSNPPIPSFQLKNDFVGELHEIRIWNKRRDTAEIFSGSVSGVELQDDLLFYLPPFFRNKTNKREVLVSPFQKRVMSTDTPFNSSLSFASNGQEINLENHLREIVSGYYPRLLNLTSSVSSIVGSTYSNANDYLYQSNIIKRRNYTILPCDNGKFKPNFGLLFTGSIESSTLPGGEMDKFLSMNRSLNLSFVNLTDCVNDAQDISLGLFEPSMYDGITGVEEASFLTNPNNRMQVYERTRDNSSNQVSIFDASNLFYGSSIYKNTLELVDNDYTGSFIPKKIKFKDNGDGSLYRADADSPHAVWSSVGFVLYTEGISVVTCPYVGSMFGKKSYTVNLRGLQPVNVLEVQAIAPTWQLNSSSNPNWKHAFLSEEDKKNEEKGFVRINRINFHDKNLNVVARTTLAQPIEKRFGDRIVFRVKMDF